MRPSSYYCSIAALTLVAFGSWETAKCEVYAELDGSGHFVQTHVVPAGRAGQLGRVWEPVGAARTSALILNPNGDLKGDSRPEIAVSPVTSLPRAVWVSRVGASSVVVTSTFDGRRWSHSVPITVTDRVDAAGPKLAFTPDGVAMVTWWEKSSAPVVRLAFKLPSRNAWIDAGTVSAEGERAKEPSILQAGSLTIIAYRTPSGIQVITRTVASSTFGDGPTPFPHGGTGPASPPILPPG